MVQRYKENIQKDGDQWIKKMRKRNFKVKILDKWSKKVLWWDKYYFSIKHLEDVEPKFQDILVESRANWVAFKEGDTVTLYMWQASNGLWYPL